MSEKPPMIAALAGRIVKMRETLGLSQTRLADLVGVSRGTMSRWESGSGFPTGSNLDRLATSLDTTVSALFGDNGKVLAPIDTEILVRALTCVDEHVPSSQQLTVGQRAKLVAFVYAKGGASSRNEIAALCTLL